MSQTDTIDKRPAEVEPRPTIGHREGDWIIGLIRSAIGTVVEPETGFTTLVHLPREDGYGITAPTKNGPALDGYGAAPMKKGVDSIDGVPTGPAQRNTERGPGQRTHTTQNIHYRNRDPGVLR